MRCFVSDIDTPLGHNLSRLLSLTAVGSRKEGENEEEENASGNEDGGGDKAETGSRNKKETYQVWGTLTKTEASEAQKASYEAGFGKPIPFDTGDRKRDSARRDVIEKIATHGKASRWIKGVVAVSIAIHLFKDLSFFK
jgi:adenylate kinase